MKHAVYTLLIVFAASLTYVEGWRNGWSERAVVAQADIIEYGERLAERYTSVVVSPMCCDLDGTACTADNVWREPTTLLTSWWLEPGMMPVTQWLYERHGQACCFACNQDGSAGICMGDAAVLYN
jgi:hypothetical protein